MNVVSGLGAAVGLFGAYQGHQAQQRAQDEREEQTELLREQIEVTREKRDDYADALASLEQAVEQVADSGELSDEQVETLERKGLNIDELA